MPDATGNGADSHGSSDGDTDRLRSASRRRLLTAGGATAATLLAGCSALVPEQAENLLGGDGESGGSNDEEDDEADGTPTGTPTPESDVSGIVLREASDGVKLIVTIRPPEGGGGTDWWQLETFEGEKLLRDEFEEPRTEEFTTTQVVDTDPSKIVVRAHDVDAGYGGQAILVDLKEKNLEAVNQGAEPNDFEFFEF